MKTEVVVDLVEAANAIGRHVNSRPQHKAKILTTVEFINDSSGSLLQARVVLFDTEKAAAEYLESQKVEVIPVELNG